MRNRAVNDAPAEVDKILISGGTHIRRIVDILRQRSGEGTEFWQTVPLSSAWLFYAGVFCLFSTVAMIGIMADRAALAPSKIVAQTLLSGSAAVLIAIAAVRGKILLVFPIAA